MFGDSDKFISDAEERLATRPTRAQKFLQIISYVTENFFWKRADVEKIKKILKMTYTLWPLTIASNALKSKATKKNRLYKMLRAWFGKNCFLFESMWAIDVYILHWRGRMSEIRHKSKLNFCNIIQALFHHNFVFLSNGFSGVIVVLQMLDVIWSILTFYIFFS